MWDREEWLNVERWIEPWDDEKRCDGSPRDDIHVTIYNDVSDSERLLDMDFQLQLINQRLRHIGDATGRRDKGDGERPESSVKREKFHRILGPIRGEQQCDWDKGCASTLRYDECPKCFAYPILSAEAIKLGPGCGPQLVEGLINCRYWNLETVKTFPLKKASPKWFELHPEVLRTRMGARVTVVVKPGAGGIDIVRGERLGHCQKLNQVRCDHFE